MYDHDEWCPPVDEMDDFSYKMKELIAAEVEHRIGEVVDGLARSKRLNKELYKANQDLKNKLYVTGHAKDNMMREAMTAARREVFGGVYPGDICYHPRHVGIKIPCETCNDKGKVSALVGDTTLEIQCPKCGGYNSKRIYRYKPSDPKRLDTITLEFGRHGARHHKYYFDNSDSSSEHVFRTVEECQAWCDKKNAEIETREAKK
ncbi:hypothetical protein [Bacillus sp. 3255]|uniref:hypothetical protein n=1 Tax=Bacillus sp. 3255 TaxID=2817904 RepID=UPI00285E5FCD|nr:hypothetical protein [Bacillus sp. 3255]MDR6884873.1 DNA-directed RNA polymerase subunit RPC12/RpoP [Bacillus sp. 3255]